MSVTAERAATPPAAAKQGLKAKLISWAMKKMMASAGGGAPGSGGGPPPWVKAMLAGGGAPQSMAAMLASSRGFEGREKILGEAVAMAMACCKEVGFNDANIGYQYKLSAAN